MVLTRHALHRALAVVAVAAFSIGGAATARADSAADFYKGRTVMLVTGSDAGGGYDFSLRILAEYIKLHIPGSPSVIVENRPGSAGLNAMNFVYNAAAKDGTYIIMPYNVDAMFQMLRPTGIKYDLRKMQWLGNMAELFNVFAVHRDTGLRTIEDAKTREVIVAATGRSSQTFMVPTLFNALLGTKFKVVVGYKGTTGMTLAMERREADARIGSYESWIAAGADWIRDGKVVFLAQDGVGRSKELPNVPLYQELVSDAESKTILQFMSYPVAMSRTLAVAPEVPADRVAALRKAFMDTMKDPAFLEAAKKRRMDLSPSDHAAVEKVVAAVFSTPPAVIERVMTILQFK
jgi:tripartite-type tricarboxylate transporter receptor subunit TctC